MSIVYLVTLTLLFDITFYPRYFGVVFLNIIYCRSRYKRIPNFLL